MPEREDGENCPKIDRRVLSLGGLSLGDRVIFRKGIAEGLAVTESAKKDGKAIEEMTKIYRKVFFKKP